MAGLDETGRAPRPPERMVFEQIDVEVVSARIATLRGLLTTNASGDRVPELLIASKYFAVGAIPQLVAAGADLLGENRAEVIGAKREAAGDAPVQWDFIGALQSRKAPAIAAQVSRIHTLASTSAVRRLVAAQEGGATIPDLLVQVNVAGERGKGGVTPGELAALLDAADGLPVTGLMTMPPLAARPEDNRRWFADLRTLADRHGLRECSMGTSQDLLVAAQEGATVVRVGGLLTGDDAWNALTRAAG